jgi:hypothetical protein
MPDDPPRYIVRSWTALPGELEQITFVDMAGRVMNVVITRRHALNGGAHQAIVARMEALRDPPGLSP